MRRLIFWGCLPLAITQAMRVRRTAPRFAGASGPNSGIVEHTGDATEQTNKPARTLIVIGDSVAAGVGASTHRQALVGQTALHLTSRLQSDIAWHAIGQIGASTQQISNQLVRQLPRSSVDFFVISAGVNDVTSLTNTRNFRGAVSTLLGQLHAHSPQAIIAVAGLPPMQSFPLLPQPLRALMGLRAKILNAVMQAAIAGHAQAIFVPVEFDPRPDSFAGDGFHPSEASYQEFGRVIAEALVDRGKAQQ
jgi:lysophospholipase L1-like esterase